MERLECDTTLCLVAACCDPALDTALQQALALYACGLTEEEIAARFLAPVTIIKQRLREGLRSMRHSTVPEMQIYERHDRVVTAIYLVFTTGYVSTSARGDLLCGLAIALARRLRTYMPPGYGTVDALLALMLLHHARRAARFGPDGEPIPLPEQDRGRWDHELIGEGRELLERIAAVDTTSALVIQAHIAALHSESTSDVDTDWRAVAHLYQRLSKISPSPIVEINRAVAVSIADTPTAGLRVLDAVKDSLGGYYLWHAARADILRRAGHLEAALIAYRRARELAQDPGECRFLERRIADLDSAN